MWQDFEIASARYMKVYFQHLVQALSS
jgi:hypothetical protein